MESQRSRRRRRDHSLAIELLQRSMNPCLKSVTLGERVVQLLDESGDLLVDWLPVLVSFHGAHVPTRGEHESVLGDLVDSGAGAEAGDVRVLAGIGFAAPGVISASDVRDVLVGELSVNTVDHGAELSGIDEQRLAAPVAPSASLAGSL